MDVLSALVDLVSGSPWTYALVLGIAALDAIFPVVPSETTAIAAGVLAGTGELNIALVIAAAAAGAFIGDTSTYSLGRVAGERAANRLAGRRLGWAKRTLDTRGAYLIVGARFVPGGRTATMLAAGLTLFRARRFLRLAAVAAIIWGSYAGLLGYLGGRTFEEHPWQGLLLAFGLAVAVVFAVELVRRFRLHNRLRVRRPAQHGIERDAATAGRPDHPGRQLEFAAVEMPLMAAPVRARSGVASTHRSRSRA